MDLMHRGYCEMYRPRSPRWPGDENGDVIGRDLYL